MRDFFKEMKETKETEDKGHVDSLVLITAVAAGIGVLWAVGCVLGC